MSRGRCLFALLLVACKPDIDGSATLVEAPRVLAIRSTPAEAPVGASVTYDALVAAPDGAVVALQWALCHQRRSLADTGSMAPACLAPSAPFLTDLGTAAQVTASLPPDACRDFGPDSPAPGPGQPSGRPADPDLSGGYYQPVRVRLLDPAGDAYAAGSTRLACGLAGATGEQLKAFADGYRANVNPAPGPLAQVNGSSIQTLTDGTTLSAGATVSLRLSWPSCADDAACAGSENYLLFVPSARALVTRREALVASWFATAGRFDSERTGSAGDDLATTSDNRWTAPTTPGPVTFWVVLRDDRGGVGWTSVTIAVR